MTKNKLGKQVFNNGFRRGTDEYRKARRYMDSILQDLVAYAGMPDPNEPEDLDMGSWADYGLSFEPFVSDKTGYIAYYRYIITCGGPSAELRMFPDGSVHAVFLDWFKGIAWDVSQAPAAQWAYSQFASCEMMQWGHAE